MIQKHPVATWSDPEKFKGVGYESMCLFCSFVRLESSK